MPEPVLVLDGAQRGALAVVRSLGSRGIPVHVGQTGAISLAARSRFCAGPVTLPDPATHPGAFGHAVMRAAAQLGIRLVLPVTDTSMVVLSESPEFQAADAPHRLMGPSPGAFARLSDKARLLDMARELGIPVPQTRLVHSREQLETAVAETEFKCVLKPARSKALLGAKVLSTSVSLISSPAELASSRALAWVDAMPILVQRFIPGSGAGVFALYGDSGPAAWFAHRRLREKPPSGGVSVLCESVAVDPVMRGHAERLLSAADWFGPAMVEFRVDPEGRPWLMEVNGRLWGSLQLAIDCGVDFPWLLYQLCRGEEVHGPKSYESGCRLRWLLGDLDHLLLQIRGKGTAESIGKKLASLAAFMNFFDHRTKLEVLRRQDPAPFRHELREWVRALGRAAE